MRRKIGTEMVDARTIHCVWIATDVACLEFCGWYTDGEYSSARRRAGTEIVHSRIFLITSGAGCVSRG